MTETPEFPHDDALFRRIVEESPAAVLLLSNEHATRVLYGSPRVEDITGFTPDELRHELGLWFGRMHPDDADDVSAAWNRAVDGDERFSAEYRFRHRSGEWRLFRDTSSPVRGAGGSTLYRQSFTEDLTSERFATEQAERSEARYRDLVERLPVIVYVDTDDEIPRSLYMSPNSADILGYTPDEFLTQPDLFFRKMHPEDRERIAAMWAESIRTRKPFHAEYRDVKPDGSVVWVRDQSLLVRDDEGEPLFWQGVLLDITAEREAATTVRRHEARYQDLVEHLPVIVYIDAYGAAEASRYVSPNVLDVLGHPAEAFDGTFLWQQLMHPDDLDRALAAWGHGWSTGTGWSVEYRFVHPNGHEVRVRDEARMVIDPATGEHTWQGVIIDLTAQEQSRLELEQSERRYRALVEQVPAIMYEMGPDDERRTLFVSPHVEAILGYERQEWLDQPDIWVELLHPDDRERELAAHDRHNETGEPWQREYRLIASDGREVWVHDQAQLVHDAEGSRWLGVMLDITPQKDAEELLRLAKDELEMRVLTRTAELEDANEMMSLEIGERRRIEGQLREAETRYRLLLEDLPAAVYSWETNWDDDPQPADTALYTSPQLERILGFPREEWHTPGFWQERLHPHDRDRIIPLAEHTIETGEPFSAEYRYLAADGRVVWVLDRATLRTRDRRGRPRLFQGVMLDITELKIAEAKALEAEERFRLLAEQGPFVVYQYELEHADPPVIHMRYLSPSANDLLGIPASQWESDLENRLSLVHPDDMERVRSVAEAALRTGGPWNHVFRMIAADGRVVWLLDRGQAIERDDHGRPTFFQGVMLDVTEEAEVHAELESSEAVHRSVVETMPAVPWTEVVDPETGRGRYRFIGPQVEEVFGYTPEQLLMEPDHFFRLVHPDDRERTMAASDRCDATGEPWDEFYRVTHRDGSVHWIFSYGRRTFEDGKPVWHGISIDVTRHIASGVLPIPLGEAAGSS